MGWRDYYDQPYEIRDSLAYAIHEKHFSPGNKMPSCGWPANPGLCVQAGEEADIIMDNWPDSFFAAQQGAAAKAWDEGWDAHYENTADADAEPARNPYREDT